MMESDGGGNVDMLYKTSEGQWLEYLVSPEDEKLLYKITLHRIGWFELVSETKCGEHHC